MPARISETERIQRFWRKVEKTVTCWIWKGNYYPPGYGQFSLGHNRPVYAHRFAYVLLKGPIPTGLQLDHLCRNRGCVNPEHLEAVSSQVNLLRGQGTTARHAAQTHCVNGHPFNRSNTYIHHKANGLRERKCIACIRIRKRRYRLENMQRRLALR